MLNILLGSFAGALCMILFGSMVPGVGDRFKFAPLLNMLIGKGGVIHYLVALIFTIFYDWIWRTINIEPNLPVGIAFGSVNGIIGMLVAKIILIRNAIPVASTYFYNIIMAHLIFGAGTVLGYQFANTTDLLSISNQVKILMNIP